ncbi:MAG: hypothetical protein Q9Q40_11145 [Acidobacteriota bacterium]|nr:hypothetical protein [Acidobacteriota bacterium]
MVRPGGESFGGKMGVAIVALLALVFGLPGVTSAEEITGRWRFELHIGGVDPGDSIISDADRTMTITDISGRDVFIPDPRPRWMSADETRMSADTRFDLRVGYGFAAFKNSELVVDVGIGYYTSFLQDIQVAFSLDRNDPDYQSVAAGGLKELAGRYGDPVGFESDQFFRGVNENWDGMLVDGGQLRLLPISANVMLRFRPTKRLNPYIGAGVGYYFVDFTPTAAWTALTEQLDASCVSYATRASETSFRTRRLDHNPERFGTGFDEGSWEYYNGATPPEGFFNGDPCRRVSQYVTVPTDAIFPNPDYNPALPEDPVTNPRLIPHTNAGQVVPVEYQDFGHDLEAPRIETPNSLFLELRFGTEWQWRPKTAFFADARFTWADREMRITVDGREHFGEGVPSGYWDEAEAPGVAGGEVAYITVGGLVLPAGPVDPFTGTRVSQPQPGEYLIKGGRMDYGGWNFSVGVRFTL